ncbi:MAG TPA: fumarylacetoacetate hydrolase family protein [Steroidobacteraceae bacterium]|nr:fumarylacetoacetate hydrolase family protein [Steroidobacteraceae bacterium]
MMAHPLRENSYRLATYTHGGAEPRAGIVVDDEIIDVAAALAGAAAPAMSVLQLLGRWAEIHPRLQHLAREKRRRSTGAAALQVADVRFLAPILYPGNVFCAGANYRDHVTEMSKALNLPPEPDPHELGLKPWHFIKASASCIRGSGELIKLPAYSKKVDWEVEIAVIVGRECRDTSIERAMDFVAGLSIVNDLSARDHLRRPAVPGTSPFHFDWMSQKCFEGALPFGPWICPLDDIDDIGNLGMRLWVNEELMQDSSSANMIFSVAEQIAHLSSRLTLRPGDVIATGTPAGCGAARGVFLKPGDRVSIRVEQVGTLVNEFTN